MPIRADYPETNTFDALTYKIGANSHRIRLVLAILYSPFIVLFAMYGEIVGPVLLTGFLIWVVGGVRTARRLVFHPRYQVQKFKQILLNQKRIEYSELKQETIVMEPSWGGWQESRWLVYVEDEDDITVQFADS